jgi:NADH:ubiquinone oxidoreductase subunit 5 (subunit L)/multisubunit Na+/H+ antiporter MnhA subunit
MNTPETHTKPMTAKNLQTVIGYLAAVLVCCSILMWSVFNFWLNVLAYSNRDASDQNWIVAIALVVVTSIVPFCFALRLLLNTFEKKKKPATK